MIRYEQFYPSIQVDDLHPEPIYNKELSLAKAFVLDNLTYKSDLDPCPISGLKRDEIIFEKWGCSYAICPKTWSISLGLLPDSSTITKYFHESELAKYRCLPEYQESFSRLRSDLWANQLEWIEGRVRRYIGMEQYSMADWGSRMVGWIKVLETADFISELAVAEPIPPVKAVGTVNDVDIILLFDVIQHCPNPKSLLSDIYSKLRSNGLLLLTCRSGSGFDILTLAGESESIFPFDHLCLPSPEGMKVLLERVGFEIIELTTPGLLDVKLVEQVIDKIPKKQYFQRYLLSKGQIVQERLQSFLQQNNLSSHLRVVAKKPE